MRIFFYSRIILYRKQSISDSLIAEAKHFLIVGGLTEQTRQMKLEFSKLATATMKSLTSQKITPRQLLGAIEPKIAQEYRALSTVPDILASLCLHTSFFNYRILEQIILKFEDQNLRKKLEDYKAAVKSYCKNPLRQLPPNALANTDQNHRSENLTQLNIKLDAEWHTATYEDIQGFKQKLASVLEVKEEVLNLCSVEKGCILVKFLLLTSIAEDIFHQGLTDEQKQILKSISVIQMECLPYNTCTWMPKLSWHKKSIACVRYASLVIF